MGHGAAATRKTLIDNVKECVERTNECIRDTAAVGKSHNEFVRIVEGKIDEVRGIAHRASTWSEANEAQLTNVRKHLDGQFANVQRTIDSRLRAQDALIRETVNRLPADGFFARLKWLFFGPGSHEYAECVTVSPEQQAAAERKGIVPSGFFRHGYDPEPAGSLPSAGRTIAEEHGGKIGLV